MSSSNIRRDGWTAERQLRFLDMLASTRSVSRAAASAGMTRESAYRLRRRRDGGLFGALWDRALQGHEVEGGPSRPAAKTSGNRSKVTKWKKWKDPCFQPFRQQLR